MTRKTRLKNYDKSLLKGIQGGKHHIFKLAFEQYYEKLYYFSLNFVNNTEAAEEIVQEVFLTIWEKRKELRVHTSFKGFLYTSVKNRCISYLRNKYNLTFELTETPETLEISSIKYTEETVLYNELCEILKHTIDSLPERCKIIFNLSRNSGLSYKEIANELSISPESVKTQIGIALKKLKKQLENYNQQVMS